MPSVKKINPAAVVVEEKNNMNKRGRPRATETVNIWQYTDSKTGETVSIDVNANIRCEIYGPHGERAQMMRKAERIIPKID